MISPARLAACLLAVAPSAAFAADDTNPPVVIERAPEPPPKLDEVTALRTENQRLTDELAAARSQLEQVRSELSAVTAARDQSATALEENTRELAALRAKLAKLEKTPSADLQAKLAADLQVARDEKAALEARLAAANKPAADSAELAAKLAEAENKLATSLRSYSLLQAENEQLKAGAGDHEKLAAELASLRQEKSALEARLASAEKPAEAPADPDVARRLAETEDKLATALRSYSLLQTENDQLKTDAAHAASSAQAAAAKASAESAAQISALYDTLRQTQAQATALAAENSELKTRLALSGPPPGTTLAAPVRPGSPAASAALAPAPAPTEPAPAASAAPRTHKVAPGDTLGKISRQYYGTPNRWQEILEANRDVIKNENAVPLGATLRIP